jgi:2-keto-4-pentenoate hydratase
MLRSSNADENRMDRHHDAAELLLSARRDPSQRLSLLPALVAPKTVEQAYLVQREIMARLGAIGGWKVGSPGPASDVFTCAPLPKSGVVSSPAEATGSDRGVEAEIALLLSADLPTRDTPYTEAEVRAAIGSAHPAIEVLASRFVDPNRPDKLSMLADSLQHHSLVVGPAIAAWDGLDLASETVEVLVDGVAVKRGTGNPAGGMVRLLMWLANTGARWAGGLVAGQVVTTGSWTGKDVAGPGQEVRIRFAHCGEASVRFVS